MPSTLRLFASYQRYSALLLVIALSSAASALWLATALSSVWRWPCALALAGFAISCARFAWIVASRWPRKLRATRLALRRIESGRFSPASLQRYCEDPCFRVVAREILRHSALSPEEQRRVVREFKAQAGEPAFVMFVDPSAPGAVQLEGALFETES